MTILVTGAGGQVGRELGSRCLPGDIALSRQALDITDSETLARMLDQYHPDVVINTAAYTAVDRAENEPQLAQAVNSDAVAELAKACAERAIPVLHLSTDYVFNGNSESPYPEDAVPDPLNVYGKSKWIGEEGLRQNQPDHIILRTSWVFGQFGNNFLKTMLNLGAEGCDLRVISDQIGGPTPSASVADALLLLARRIEKGDVLPWGTWHYAGQPFVSWYEFAQAIFEAARKGGYITQLPSVHAIATEDYPTAATRPAQSSLSMTQTQRSLGLDPPDWRTVLPSLIHSLLAA